MIKYSIVIPTYNRAEKLLRAIKSCLNQTYKNYELIVVDDGSTDSTRKLVDEINNYRVKYHYIKNSGASNARNYGIKHSSGEYVCFLDSDDEYLPGKLAECEKVLDGNDKVVLYSKVLLRREYQEVVKPHVPYQEGQEISDYLFCQEGFVPTPSIVLPRSLAMKVTWNTTIGYGDDTDYVIRLSKAGAKFIMIDKVLVICDDSDINNRLSLQKKYKEHKLWLDSMKSEITHKAYIAFNAMHMSYSGFWYNPFKYSYYILLSWMRGIFSTQQCIKCFARATLSPALLRRSHSLIKGEYLKKK